MTNIIVVDRSPKLVNTIEEMFPSKYNVIRKTSASGGLIAANDIYKKATSKYCSAFATVAGNSNWARKEGEIFLQQQIESVDDLKKIKLYAFDHMLVFEEKGDITDYFFMLNNFKDDTGLRFPIRVIDSNHDIQYPENFVIQSYLIQRSGEETKKDLIRMLR